MVEEAVYFKEVRRGGGGERRGGGGEGETFRLLLKVLPTPNSTFNVKASEEQTINPNYSN